MVGVCTLNSESFPRTTPLPPKHRFVASTDCIVYKKPGSEKPEKTRASEQQVESMGDRELGVEITIPVDEAPAEESNPVTTQGIDDALEDAAESATEVEHPPLANH